MPDLLWFDWRKAADGYSIETFDPDEIDWDAGYTEDGELKLRDGASESMALLVGLIGEGQFPVSRRKSLFLMPQGWTTTHYRPLEEHPALFREFADTKCSPEGVKVFADKYGYLTNAGMLSPVTPWYREIRKMRLALDWWERGSRRKDLTSLVRVFNEQTQGKTSVKLEQARHSGRLDFYLVPDSLLMALWLQFGQTVSGNVQMKRCLW